MPFPDRAFFDEVYEGRAPWDIGDAQPDLVALLAEYPPPEPILDLGCGTGDLVIALASRGLPAVGIDFVPTAIDEARARAARLPPDLEALARFEVADALRPSSLPESFGSVVDSGFYHLFGAGDRRGLAGELRRTLPPGGRYYMLGFAIEIPSPDAPRQVTEAEISTVFSAEEGWAIRVARPARFATVGFGDIPALAVCLERERS